MAPANSKPPRAMAINRDEWKTELLSHETLFEKFHDRLPSELERIRGLLLSGLWAPPKNPELAHE